MCIFKGNSIYKNGSGGGLKNGGELIDAEFINLENNKVSQYKNENRIELNFVLDTNEPFFTFVELETVVNATINIYYAKNGVLYKLNYSPTNSIAAGKNYLLSIIGENFLVDDLTIGSIGPSGIIVNGDVYGLVNINGLLWSTSNLKLNVGKNYFANDEYYYYGNQSDIDDLDEVIQEYGIRLPTSLEFSDMVNYLGGGTVAVEKIRSDSGWVGAQGTNESGLSIYPKGYYNTIGGAVFDSGYSAFILLNSNGSNIVEIKRDNTTVGWSSTSKNANVRFVLDQ